MSIPLRLTAMGYGPDLRYLRQVILKNRSPRVTPLLVSNADDVTARLFIRHSDLYISGFSFAGGDYYFQGEVVPKGGHALEFPGSYYELGLGGATVHLDAHSLGQAVYDVAKHKPTAQGSNFLKKDKQSLIRLIFSISEALRFFTIEQAVSKVLVTAGSKILINDYAGSGKALNSWETWSQQKDWPSKGIAVLHPSSPYLPK